MAGELAIVLSGGGAKGAFQVGVLDELITNRGVKIDIAVGTSTGSIQALAVAQDDIPKLLQLWLGLRNNSDIYVKKPLGVAGGIIGADSIYDAKGLKKLLKQNADDAKLRSTGKKLRLGVVNLGTGEFRSIDESVHRRAAGMEPPTLSQSSRVSFEGLPSPTNTIRSRSLEAGARI